MDWNSSILWGIIGLIGGGLISTVYFFIGKKRKKLLYEIITETLISNNIKQIKDIVVKNNNTIISSLYVSKIKIKNVGNTIIEQNDFSSTYPLEIITNGEFILNKDNISQQNINNDKNDIIYSLNFITESSPKRSIICYDYIPQRGLITLDIIHTNPLHVSGKLKEGKIVNKTQLSIQTKRMIIATIIIVILLLFSISFFHLGRKYEFSQLIDEYEEISQILDRIDKIIDKLEY